MIVLVLHRQPAPDQEIRLVAESIESYRLDGPSATRIWMQSGDTKLVIEKPEVIDAMLAKRDVQVIRKAD